MGLRNRPTYRVVVIDSHKARDGKYLEAVGHYDPRTKHLDLDTERISHWLSRGAQASDTVSRLVHRFSKQQPAAAAETPAEIVPGEAAPAGAGAEAPAETPKE
jgi:small subunit ribosomal protein S16